MKATPSVFLQTGGTCGGSNWAGAPGRGTSGDRAGTRVPRRAARRFGPLDNGARGFAPRAGVEAARSRFCAFAA